MIHIPLHDRLPELAECESRTLSISNSPQVPDGDYALLEAYCEDPDCDCRRVFLSVCSRRKVEAVIAFGWEDREFYARWMGTRDSGMVDELKGPCLDLSTRSCGWFPTGPGSPIQTALISRMWTSFATPSGGTRACGSPSSPPIPRRFPRTTSKSLRVGSAESGSLFSWSGI